MKYSEDVIHVKFQELLDGSKVLKDLWLIGYEELEGMSDTKPQDISCVTVLCEI